MKIKCSKEDRMKMMLQQQPQLPLGILIKESGKAFLFFVVGLVMIISLQELNLKGIAIRFATMGTLFGIIFLLNVFLINFFDKTRKQNNNTSIWRRTFATGYVLSLPIFYAHHLIIMYFYNTGILDPKWLNKMSFFEGWRLFVFVLYSNLVVYSFVFLIQNFVLNQYEKSRIQMELLKMKASNSDTVNQLLQQQVKPHFLFNALNILKSLIKRDQKAAENYLLRLSDFLRVSISQNDSGLASVKDELKICDDYMQMQKIRFGDAIQYEVLIDKEDEVIKQNLPFFSIQPCLENAIKHNELTEDKPLKIQVRKEGDYILVCNNLQKKQTTEASTGNGQRILKERYKILSGDELIIEKTLESYTVKLKILEP